MNDLQEAIRFAQAAVDATPEDHSNRATYLNNLGIRLGDLYSAKILTWHPFSLRRPPHPIIAPLHQPPLQLNRILDILIPGLLALNLHPFLIPRVLRYLEALQHGMKTSIIPFRK